MASKLVQIVSALNAGIKDAARSAFQRTEIGAAVSRASNLASRGKSLARSLGSRATRFLGSFVSPRRSGGRVSQEEEVQAVVDLVRAFGGDALGEAAQEELERQMSSGSGGSNGPPVTTGDDWDSSGPRRRQRGTRTEIDVVRGEQVRVRNNNPVFTGEMIEVESSNVHSIGFDIDEGQSDFGSSGRKLIYGAKGTLKIRFLGKGAKGVRQGPGPLYAYSDVPATLFMNFQRAASKGTFVWDEIRVRGSVSGHRYSYELIGVSQGYVPRQAGIRRGHQGEFFIPRTFEGTRSQLPMERASRSGPNRAEPNRGTPNRGRRN